MVLSMYKNIKNIMIHSQILNYEIDHIKKEIK